MVEGHGWHARVGAGCFSPRWKLTAGGASGEENMNVNQSTEAPALLRTMVSVERHVSQRYAATRMYQYAHYCWCKSGQCIWLLTVMTVSALHYSSVSIGFPSPVDTFSGIFCPSTTPPSHSSALSFLLVPFIHALWSRHRSFSVLTFSSCYCLPCLLSSLFS